MLKAVENLIVANNEGCKSAKQGNHSFERVGNVAKFFYHGNCVCKVVYKNNNPNSFDVFYDDCGYKGFSSTSRTLSSYCEYFGGDWKKQVNS